MSRKYDDPPSVPSVLPKKPKAKPETKTARLSIVITPSFAREWKTFCDSYNMSYTVACETAMTLYMQAIQAQEKQAQ